jgi:hypothetical protein
MSSICTCGTPLPEDSRFCPMCGRPFSQEAKEAELAQAKGAQERARLEQATHEKRTQPISFRNSHALRASYFGGLLAAFLSNVPFLNLLCFVWYPASAFLSVYLYRRKSGARPTPAQGARLGVMTGILTFAITIVFTAITWVMAGDGSGFSEAFRKQIEETPGQEEVKQQVLALLDNPAALGFLVLMSLIMMLVVMVGFGAAGGVLGAKVLDDD